VKFDKKEKNMINKEFGDYLKELRKKNNKTLEELAKHLNVSLSFLCDIEKKRRPPFSKDKIEKLATFLFLTPEEKRTLYDLQGQRNQDVPEDIKEVVISFKDDNNEEVSDLIRFACRETQSGKVTAKQWQDFIDRISKKSEDSND